MTESRPDTRLYVTEEEYTRLLNTAEPRQALYARFGGNRVWLEESDLNEWAFKLLVEWRGVAT